MVEAKVRIRSLLYRCTGGAAYLQFTSALGNIASRIPGSLSRTSRLAFVVCCPQDARNYPPYDSFASPRASHFLPNDDSRTTRCRGILLPTLESSSTRSRWTRRLSHSSRRIPPRISCPTPGLPRLMLPLMLLRQRRMKPLARRIAELEEKALEARSKRQYEKLEEKVQKRQMLEAKLLEAERSSRRRSPARKLRRTARFRSV